MAYVAPTPADLKALYPAFADVADATVQAWMNKAPVDASWSDTDRASAIIAWAAYQMVSNGIGGGDIAGYASAGVSRLKSGTLDVSFSDSASGASGYGSNAYGRLWLELLARNKGGPRVTISPRGPLYEWEALGIQNNGEVVPWADF